MVVNAATLFGSTLLTAGLGAVYWALAARVFDPSAVGIAAAAISSMLLIGQVATFGFGTVLIGELARHGGAERRLIASALAICATAGVVFGAVFVIVSASVVPELNPLRDPAGIALFAAGVAVTAAGLVLDQAFVGMLRGGLQLARNALASVAKLLALAGVAVAVAAGTGSSLALFGTWVLGGIASMALLLAIPRPRPASVGRPVWRAIEGVGRLAARHHLLNLSILAPGLLLPLVVTALLSAKANAYFYIAYLIAGFAFAVPAALVLAVYAAGSHEVERLPARVRVAFGLSVATGVVVNLGVLVAGGLVLSIFGPAYATNALPLLRLFSLGIFAVTLNSLYVPIARVERRFLRGAALMTIGMVVELAFVVAGAMIGGLEGVGWGWLVGYTVGVLPLVPAVYRVGVRGRVVRLSRDTFGPLPPLAERPTPAEPGPTFIAVEPAATGRPRIALAIDGPELAPWQAACLTALGGNASDVQPLGDAAFTAGRFDVLLDLRAMGDEPSDAASPIHYWRFAYGAKGLADVRRATLAELARGDATIRVALVTDGGRHVLREGLLQIPTSLAAAVDSIRLETAHWPAQVLLDGLPASQPGAPSTAVPPDRQARAQPDPTASAGFAATTMLRINATGRRLLAAKRVMTQHSDWNVGIVERREEAFLDGWDPAAVRWLPRRAGRYTADPFGLERDGRLHVFLEDYDQRLRRAVISHVEVDAAGAVSEPRPVVEPGFHVSYPFLLTTGGETWMIPETADANELRLYRAVDFPHVWRLEATLLSGVPISDPTIIERDGRWWLFGTSRGRGVDHALRVWHAPRLTDGWQLHRLDPVKIDARSARPAGTPFVVDGQLYRPAQDGSRRYGGGISINRVRTLTTQAFDEEVVTVLTPGAGSAYPDGLHTLSSAGSRTLVDGNAVRFVPEALRADLWLRLGRGPAGAVGLPTGEPE
jgi:O-antigen/teichoic acid export membrane protein